MADKKTEVERDQVADKKRKQKPPGEHVRVFRLSPETLRELREIILKQLCKINHSR